MGTKAGRIVHSRMWGWGLRQSQSTTRKENRGSPLRQRNLALSKVGMALKVLFVLSLENKKLALITVLDNTSSGMHDIPCFCFIVTNRYAWVRWTGGKFAQNVYGAGEGIARPQTCGLAVLLSYGPSCTKRCVITSSVDKECNDYHK